MRLGIQLAVGLLVSLGAMLLIAGQSAPTDAFTGCAMPLAANHDFLTLCEPHNCALLRGEVQTTWAGHTVELRGALHAATSTQPRTIVVTKIIKVGDICKAACQPSISGRGIGPKDKPEGEGGTPGAAPDHPKPSPPNN